MNEGIGHASVKKYDLKYKGKASKTTEAFSHWFWRNVLQSIFFVWLFYVVITNEPNILIRFFIIIECVVISDILASVIASLAVYFYYIKKKLITKSIYDRFNDKFLKMFVTYIIFVIVRSVFLFIGLIWIISAYFYPVTQFSFAVSYIICIVLAKVITFAISKSILI